MAPDQAPDTSANPYGMMGCFTLFNPLPVSSSSDLLINPFLVYFGRCSEVLPFSNVNEAWLTESSGKLR